MTPAQDLLINWCGVAFTGLALSFYLFLLARSLPAALRAIREDWIFFSIVALVIALYAWEIYGMAHSRFILFANDGPLGAEMQDNQRDKYAYPIWQCDSWSYFRMMCLVNWSKVLVLLFVIVFFHAFMSLPQPVPPVDVPPPKESNQNPILLLAIFFACLFFALWFGGKIVHFFLGD